MRREMRRTLNRNQSTGPGANSVSGNNSKENNMESSFDLNSIITDMAQGFVQAQANNTTTETQNGNNEDLVAVLKKISNQLEQIQQSQNGTLQNQQKTNNPIFSSQVQPQSENSVQGKQNQLAQSDTKQLDSSISPNVEQQSPQTVSRELERLFSQIINNGDNNKVSKMNSQNSDSAMQNSNIAVQTASQVLAKAQYELANELELSLNKLKQVISESEQIANRISKLLGDSGKEKA